MPFVAGVRWTFRGKDAGRADSSAIGATEDAASGRSARPGRHNLDFARLS